MPRGCPSLSFFVHEERLADNMPLHDLCLTGAAPLIWEEGGGGRDCTSSALYELPRLTVGHLCHSFPAESPCGSQKWM